MYPQLNFPLVGFQKHAQDNVKAGEREDLITEGELKWTYVVLIIAFIQDSFCIRQDDFDFQGQKPS